MNKLTIDKLKTFNYKRQYCEKIINLSTCSVLNLDLGYLWKLFLLFWIKFDGL